MSGIERKMTPLAFDRIPSPVIRRLSLYLRQFEVFRAAGIMTLSSRQLGDALALTDVQVRKDLACLGALGHAGIGYDTNELVSRLHHVLGTDQDWDVVLIGAGNLGSALASYGGFAAKRFRIVGIFDLDPGLAPRSSLDAIVLPMERLEEFVARHGIRLALVAVPGPAAQAVVDRLSKAGIEGVLNFAPVTVTPPAGVKMISVDLAIQLEQLAFQVRAGK